MTGLLTVLTVGDTAVGQSDVSEGEVYGITINDIKAYTLMMMMRRWSMFVSQPGNTATQGEAEFRDDDGNWAAMTLNQEFTLEQVREGRLWIIISSDEPGGSFEFEYMVADDDGAVTTVAVTIDPKPVNDAPSQLTLDKTADPEAALDSVITTFTTTDEETNQDEFIGAILNPDQGDARYFTIDGRDRSSRKRLKTDSARNSKAKNIRSPLL